MCRKILLLGGGGHLKSVLDSLIELDEYDDIAIIDLKENVGKKVLGIPIVGEDRNLKELFNKNYNYAFITLGSIGNPLVRINLFNLISDLGFEIPNIIDKNAIVSKFSSLEKGIYIGKNAIVNAGSTISKGAIINTAAIVEHDCKIGKFAHISPGAILGGGVTIGNRTHIGLNSTVKQNVTIGKNSIIGMGSTVIGDIKNNVIGYGNPFKERNR